MVERIVRPSLVVLVGPSGSGKSTWAGSSFSTAEVVSSDHLRGVVGAGADDLSASDDAFAVLEAIVEARVARRLMTVIDTTGLDDERRHRWSALARSAGLACYAAVFRTPRKVCVDRNRERARPVPQKVVASQHRRASEVFDLLGDEGFDVIEAGAGRVARAVPAEFLTGAATLPTPDPTTTQLRFGLHLPDPTVLGDRTDFRAGLADVARAAERTGFSSLWVMDHLLQIPFVGRPWLDVLESHTTLAYLAGVTDTIRLGTMVTALTLRSPAMLAKILATLDVVSGGRVEAGIGAGNHEAEHTAYGLPFPDASERVDLLEDALGLLPAMWGAGTKPFRGRVVDLPETTCYPRPIQERIPITVGGDGPRILRLAAEHADGCNLRGSLQSVRRSVAALRGHGRPTGVEPLEISHLGTALVGDGSGSLAASVETLRGRASASAYATRVNAAVVDDHVARFAAFADVGVGLCVVSLPDLSVEAVERFGRVIDAFRTTADP